MVVAAISTCEAARSTAGSAGRGACCRTRYPPLPPIAATQRKAIAPYAKPCRFGAGGGRTVVRGSRGGARRPATAAVGPLRFISASSAFIAAPVLSSGAGTGSS